MKDIVKLAADFKDWFRIYHEESYITWFDSQTRGTIEAEIMEYLESNIENTFNQNKNLAMRIYEELNSDR